MVPEPKAPRFRHAVCPYLEMSSDGSSATASGEHVIVPSTVAPHTTRRKMLLPNTNTLRPDPYPHPFDDHAPRHSNAKGFRFRRAPRIDPAAASSPEHNDHLTTAR